MDIPCTTEYYSSITFFPRTVMNSNDKVPKMFLSQRIRFCFRSLPVSQSINFSVLTLIPILQFGGRLSSTTV